MNIAAPFIQRPVATTLLTFALALAGAVAFSLLPVAPLPQVDFPTIAVQAQLPGASPETMAATVAAPLERALGRIAGVNEITSQSSLGSTRVILQFDLDRDIDGAARDVQAAINAAHSLMPTGMPSNPTYRKMNPAEAPIMIIALTSDVLDQAQIYDAASTIVAQKLSQVKGIGQVSVGGSASPAVRVELNPTALNKYGIGIEDVRSALGAANANRPKGNVEQGDRNWQIYATDQALNASEYVNLIIAYRNGIAVRLSDIAEVIDSVQDLRNAGSADGKPSIVLILNKQPGANIIGTTQRVTQLLPQLRASIPSAIDMKVMMERTSTIKASLHDTERTLVTSVILVVLVVFLFLRRGRATLIPAVVVPVSLIATFAAMYLFGYSLDILSLMALTIAAGFVVDDAVVVLENTMRHIEGGMTPYAAALRGAREVGFTVLSMSLSLIAVFLPILLMGGIVGRLFREFAATLSVAILVSLAVSLTLTPMMCARYLRPESETRPGRFYVASGRVFDTLLGCYEKSLKWALRRAPFMIVLLLAIVALNIYLFVIVPKGFFPQEDTGRLMGGIQADQNISFQAIRQKLSDFVSIVRSDPAVQSVAAFTGGGQRNSGMMFITLKPLAERKQSIDEVVARLRGKLADEPGARLFLQPAQDIRMGGRPGNAQYQFTLQSDDLDALRAWTLRLERALADVPQLADVNSDQQEKGLQTSLVIDRPTAARLGVTPQQMDATLNDAFGQSLVATIYKPLNQYHVVMEVAPQYWQSPEALKYIYVRANPASLKTGTLATATSGGSQITTASGNITGTTSGCITITVNGCLTATTATGGNAGNAPTTLANAVSTAAETLVPLAAFTRYEATHTALQVNHQGQFAASTITFNLPLGVSLGEATRAIRDTMARIGMPDSITGSFEGTARAFQASVNNQPILILTALLTVYIVLGVLYESYVHPITILSTLPSAGVGALLALMLFRTDFTIIALIGVILLIGIVKKNAIMMIDFALDAERTRGLRPEQAIFEACLLRFRPIMMTTMAAMLGALPLVLGTGEGAEMRRPLGIAVVGGLLVSQLLTLYTTPVVYLYLDRFRLWCQRMWNLRQPRLEQKGA
ncbi:MAG TPA: efflux RND transporter permease subunit [Burkholderiales bacterium]|nr:efflux RND transporter permease subunit [Burkholderiales bacterium]